MAGKFVISNYERDNATNGPIKIQAETITTWNPAGTAARTGSFIRARGSKKAYGTRARMVTLSRKIGDGTDYNSASVSVSVPVLTIAAYAALSDGQIVAYQLKTDWVVTKGGSPETTR